MQKQREFTFEQSLKTIRNLECGLSYQKKWQDAVMQHPAYFRKKNQLVALVREVYLQTEDKESLMLIDGLRQQLSERVAPILATKGLQIIENEGGQKILPVSVCTDIEDADFLQAFQDGVQESYSQSSAARPNGVSIKLKWIFIGVETLYPYGIVLVEWTGLSSDLMGDSGRGRVSDEMINTLIGTYGEQKSVP